MGEGSGRCPPEFGGSFGLGGAGAVTAVTWRNSGCDHMGEASALEGLEQWLKPHGGSVGLGGVDALVCIH